MFPLHLSINKYNLLQTNMYTFYYYSFFLLSINYKYDNNNTNNHIKNQITSQ